ncbi:hypothetical protein IA539_06885 [Gordonia sp. zg691]|uniref:hypothetical protein n=1 Tax=Gordonia jinghuaiqii TaxID=2758710 RepID=UPI0016622EA7|nr:hypothetical protein [Gordonia jinghuaiqii]MBD0860936.1 hypothetical protein [Gordonia jinghuaiqii]
MTMTTPRSLRIRALAIAAGVGLAIYVGGYAPAPAEPGDPGSGSSESADTADDAAPFDAPADSDTSEPDPGTSDPGQSEDDTSDSTEDDTGSDTGADVVPDSRSDGIGVTPADPGTPSDPPAAPSPADADDAEPAPAPGADQPADDPPTGADSGPPRPTAVPATGAEDASLSGHDDPLTSPPPRRGAAGQVPSGAAALHFLATGLASDPPPTADVITASDTGVAQRPHPGRAGAFGLLAFLGINILGGGNSTSVSPAPWTLLWWVRRFGTTCPAASAEAALNPFTSSELTDDITSVDDECGPGQRSDAGTRRTDAVVDTAGAYPDASGAQHEGSPGTTMTAQVVTRSSPAVADPAVNDSPVTSTPGVLHGSVTFSDPDGHALTTTLSGMTPAADRTYLTTRGGIVTFDLATGHYTYIPALRARIAATADGAPEDHRFDTFVITADDGRGATTPVAVGLPVTSPHSAGQVTIPGTQVDDAVVGPDGFAYVTTSAGDRTCVAVLRPDGSTLTTIPISGTPGEHGVVFGPDGRGYQVTGSSDTTGSITPSTTRITYIDAFGAVATTDPIPGAPIGDLRLDADGVGYLVTTHPAVAEGASCTYVTALHRDGTVTTSESVAGPDNRLVVSTSGSVYLSSSGDGGTRLYGVARNGELTPLANVFDADGGTLWTHRDDSLYFVRSHGDPAAPRATVVTRRPDGSTTTHDGLPGRVSSLVVDADPVYVISQSTGSSHVSALASDGRLSTVEFSGMLPADAVRGPGGDLYIAVSDPVTDESAVVAVSSDGAHRIVTSVIGQAGVHASGTGDVVVTTTTMSADGQDTTRVTFLRADGTIAAGAGIAGSPISVHFDRTGTAYIPVLSADLVSDDPLTSLAVVRRDAETVVSAAAVGEPAAAPARADDGTTYIPLTRFVPGTPRPSTALVAFRRDGSTTVAGEFPGHSPRGPVIASDSVVLLVTHDAGTSTIRAVRPAWPDASSADHDDEAAVMTFDVTPAISDIDPESGVVSGSVSDMATDDGALGYLTADSQVILDHDSGAFEFTPTHPQRQAAAIQDGPAAHAFAVLVSDTDSQASTVVSVTVPVAPATLPETLE